MARYFDKTFFKFLIGFIAIIAISFSVIIVANYLGLSAEVHNQQAQNVQSLETHTESVFDN